MYKFVIRVLLLLSMSINVFAGVEEDRQYEKQRKIALKNIPKIIEQYASTIGCNIYFEPRNVVEYQMDDETVYIALVAVDVGCYGGSGTSGPLIVVLKWGASFDYSLYIDPERSLPHQTDDLSGHVSRIYVHNDRLWYETYEFDVEDPHCCPSIFVRGELRFENGMWKGYPVFQKRNSHNQ